MLPSNIQLIVGLGNPGKEYALTRHNAGAWFVEAVATQNSVALTHEKKFQGSTGSFEVNKNRCYLFIPTTFMNHSGQAVQAFANFYRIPAPNILIAHDELDLAAGDIRLKFAGGHGGHNGLRDITKLLGTADFARLRVGIGHPGNKAQVHNYVLGKPSVADKERCDAALAKALSVLPLLISGSWERAVQQLHTSPSLK